MAENPSSTNRPIPIKCPVCPSPETTKNSCPQCGTDLEPLRRLRRLPEILEEEALSHNPQENGLGTITSLAAAVALSPNSLTSRLALTRALLAEGMLNEAHRLIGHVLKLYPEDAEARELEQHILEAEQNQSLTVEAARKTARSMVWWKISSLTASVMLALLTLLVWPLRSQLTTRPTSPVQHEDNSKPADDSRHRESPLVFVDPQFPLVLIERDQDKVRLSGEVKTLPELLQVLKQTSTVHRLDLGGMKVKYENSFFYCVQSHDTLTALARRFYRHGGKWTLIQEANPSMLQNPDLLKKGEWLLIPSPLRSPDGMAPDQNNRR